MLYTAWADVSIQGKKGLYVLALTSFGRLFAVKGTKVAMTCHAAHMAEVRNEETSMTISFADRSQPEWTIVTTSPALGQLQCMLWVTASVAHTQLLLRTNLKKPPADLLPPLAVDGSLLATAEVTSGGPLGAMDAEVSGTLADLAWRGVPRTRFEVICKELGADRLLARPTRWS